MSTNITLKAMITAYLGSVDYAKLEHNSKLRYSGLLNKVKHIGPTCIPGSDPLNEAQRWHKILSQMEVANSTKNIYLSILKVVYNFALDNGLIERNPIARIKKFKSNPDRAPAYTKDEIETLQTAAQSASEKLYANFMKALFYTGCRPQELIDLKWEHVDKDFINIMSAKAREQGTISRKCNIIEPVRQTIDKAMPKVGPISGFEVFRSPTGCKLLGTNVRTAVQALCEKAGIPYKQLRNTRSGLATAMLQAGYTLYDVKDTLGHKSVVTTERYVRESLDEKGCKFKGL